MLRRAERRPIFVATKHLGRRGPCARRMRAVQGRRRPLIRPAARYRARAPTEDDAVAADVRVIMFWRNVVDTWVWIVLAIVVVAVVAALGWIIARQQRTKRLREGFGPEYDRTVEQFGDRRQA